jgi:hypothetical protein
MIPTPFAAIVLLGGLFARGGGALTLEVLLCLFGAAAAISLPALGGATVTPAVVFLPFLLWRAFRERRPEASLRNVSKSTFWISALSLWGVLSALAVPRLLAGRMQILTVDRSGGNVAAILLPLSPVSGNITQSGYALGGALTFIAARRLLSAEGRLTVFRDAGLWLAALNCLAAVINLAEFYLGLPSLLVWVRTANYAIFDSYEEAGLMRVQGTFSETSAFAAFTLPLFAFCLRLWLSRVRSQYSGFLALASLGLLLISTSTTAYAALSLYLLGCSAALLARVYLQGRLQRARALIGWATVLGLAVGAVALLAPQVFTRVANFAELTVLSKMQSSSGVERNSWNQHAWSNFLDTYGLGVGLGSARASGFALVLLSNVGLFGTLMFLAFSKAVLTANRSWQLDETHDVAVCLAARQAVIAGLVAALVSAAVFDLGIAFYVFAAAASIAPRSPRAAPEAVAWSSSSSPRWARAAASQL